MSKGSGGTRRSGAGGGRSAKTQTAEEYNNDLGVTVQSIKGALLSYASIDRWNRSNDYHLGFNGEATGLVEDLAKGDYGLASTIAKQAVERNGWGQYGARFSEKQAYVLAKAAYDNKLIGDHAIHGAGIFRDNAKEAAAMDARQRAARHARNERRRERDNNVAEKNGLRTIVKGERLKEGTSIYDKSGTAYTVIRRSGDLIQVRDANGRVTSIYKKKLYIRK